MIRKLTLFATLTVAVVLVGSGLALLLAPGSAPAPPSAVVPPAASATDVPVRPVALRPRPGRVMTLDQAIRELDLIRPSRAKLAKDFGAPLLDGRELKLSEHRGKVVLLNFWATWCPPCLEEMPAMERLWQHHKDQGFVIVAVSVDSVEAKVEPFVQKHRFTFPIVLDSAMEVANAYGVRALPSTFFVDRAGQLAALALGPRRWDGDASHSLVEALLRR